MATLVYGARRRREARSSGSGLSHARVLARQLDEGVVVTIFCDGGDKYMSTPMWRLALDEATNRKES